MNSGKLKKNGGSRKSESRDLTSLLKGYDLGF